MNYSCKTFSDLIYSVQQTPLLTLNSVCDNWRLLTKCFSNEFNPSVPCFEKLTHTGARHISNSHPHMWEQLNSSNLWADTQPPFLTESQKGKIGYILPFCYLDLTNSRASPMGQVIQLSFYSDHERFCFSNSRLWKSRADFFRDLVKNISLQKKMITSPFHYTSRWCCRQWFEKNGTLHLYF